MSHLWTDHEKFLLLNTVPVKKPDPEEPGYGVDVKELLAKYDEISLLNGYPKKDIKAEKERVSMICYALGMSSIGLVELHKLLDLPFLFSLATNEPSIENSLQQFSGSFRSQDKYTVVCESELEMLKTEFLSKARFTAAAWMNLSYYTHHSDGISLGLSTLDMLFQSRGLKATHPDTWLLDNFSK